MSDLVECYKCGGDFPRLPGIPPTLNVCVPHVHAGAAGQVELAGTPCPTYAVERARQTYHLGQAAIFAAIELWSEELVEEVPLPADGEAHPDQLVADLDGRARAEGVRW